MMFAVFATSPKWLLALPSFGCLRVPEAGDEFRGEVMVKMVVSPATSGTLTWQAAKMVISPATMRIEPAQIGISW